MKIGILRPIPPELLKIAQKVRRNIIKEYGRSFGVCDHASDLIRSLAKKQGIKVKFIEGNFRTNRSWEHHCWVRYNRIILDVTADQFNNNLDFKFKSIVFVPNYLVQNRYRKD